MNMSIVTAVLVAASAVSAYPIQWGYPAYGGVAQSSYHNSGAYDNGYSSSISPYGSNYNSWNNGFNAYQSNSASPYGSAGSSSYNQWSNNAYSNNYFGYPRFW